MMGWIILIPDYLSNWFFCTIELDLPTSLATIDIKELARILLIILLGKYTDSLV